MNPMHWTTWVIVGNFAVIFCFPILAFVRRHHWRKQIANREKDWRPLVEQFRQRRKSLQFKKRFAMGEVPPEPMIWDEELSNMLSKESFWTSAFMGMLMMTCVGILILVSWATS